MKKLFFTLGLTLLLTVFYFSLSFASPATGGSPKRGLAQTRGPAQEVKLGGPGAAAAPAAQGPVEYVLPLGDLSVKYTVENLNNGKFKINLNTHQTEFPAALLTDEKFTGFTAANETEAQKIAKEFLSAVSASLIAERKAKAATDNKATEESANEKRKRIEAEKNCKQNAKGEELEGDEKLACFTSKIEENLKKADDDRNTARDRNSAKAEADRLLRALIADRSLDGEQKIQFIDGKIEEYLLGNAASKTRANSLLTLMQEEYQRDVVGGKIAANSHFIKYFNEMMSSNPGSGSSFAAKAKFNFAVAAQSAASFARFDSIREQLQAKVDAAQAAAATGNIAQARAFEQEAALLSNSFLQASREAATALTRASNLLPDIGSGFSASDLLNKSVGRYTLQNLSTKGTIAEITNAPRVTPDLLKRLSKNINEQAKLFGQSGGSSLASAGRFGLTLNGQALSAAGIAASNTAVASAGELSNTGNCLGNLSAAGYASDFNENLARVSHHARGCGSNGQFRGLSLPANTLNLFNPNGAAQVGSSGVQAGQRLPVGSRTGAGNFTRQ